MSEAKTSVTHADSNTRGDTFRTGSWVLQELRLNRWLKNSRKKRAQNITITAASLVCAEKYLTMLPGAM